MHPQYPLKPAYTPSQECIQVSVLKMMLKGSWKMLYEAAEMESCLCKVISNVTTHARGFQHGGAAFGGDVLPETWMTPHKQLWRHVTLIISCFLVVL